MLAVVLFKVPPIVNLGGEVTIVLDVEDEDEHEDEMGLVVAAELAVVFGPAAPWLRVKDVGATGSVGRRGGCVTALEVVEDGVDSAGGGPTLAELAPTVGLEGAVVRLGTLVDWYVRVPPFEE